MTIQIASFSGNIDLIIKIERQHPSEAIILMANAAREEELDAELLSAISDLRDFYKYFEITPELKCISSREGFPSLVTRIAEIILSQPPTKSILINPSDGSRDLAFALLSAGLLVRQIYDMEINFILFPEDFEASPNLQNPFFFNPFPIQMPDATDKSLLEQVERGGTFQEFSKQLNLSKAAISHRLRNLSDHDFVQIDGRTRILTPQGQMIVDIHRIASQLQDRTLLDLIGLNKFVTNCKRLGGYSFSPSENAIDLKSTFGALSCLWLLGVDLSEFTDITVKFGRKSRYFTIQLANRTFRANSRVFHRAVSICDTLGILNKIPSDFVQDFLEELYDNDSTGFMQSPGSGEPNIQSTWESIVVVKLLDLQEIPNSEEFVKSCMVPDGGFLYNPLAPGPNLASTYNGLSLAKLFEIPLKQNFLNRTINYLKSLWHERAFMSVSGRGPYLWDNHDAVLCLKLLEINLLPYTKRLLEFIFKLQHSSGGFKPFINAPPRKISCAHSYGALGLISLLEPTFTDGRQVDPLIDRPGCMSSI